MVGIKVCGITRLDDALALDAMGVDYLGFNFYPPSPRYIPPEAAGVIAKALRTAVPVGVFVDPSPAALADAVGRAGVRIAQIHAAPDLEALHSPVPLIEAVPVASRETLTAAAGRGADWLLLDAPSRRLHGGTGRAFRWEWLREAPPPKPFFLAGGIGPANLAEALSYRPYAVDLNSRVEAAPGRKDMEAVGECLRIAGRIRAG